MRRIGLDRMERGSKIAIASGVFLVGLALAFLFRPEQRALAPSRGAGQQFGLRGLCVGAGAATGWPLDAAGAVAPAGPLGTPRGLRPGAVAARAAPAVGEAPFTAARQGLVPTAPAGTVALRPVSLASNPAEAGAGATQSARPAALRPAVQDPLAGLNPDQLRRHKIVDGDSLADLALHYLGSADRAPQIFQLNRQKLGSPGMLPIGQELLLPPRTVAGEPGDR